MHFANIGSLTIHYAIDGSADDSPLVFVHSLGTDLRLWDTLIPHFAADFKIIRYDLRGHGLSDCPPASYSIQNHADDLTNLLDKLQIDSTVLVGMSVGGMIAMSFAAAYPQRVEKLVLADTNTTIGTTAMWNERIQTLRQNGMESLAEPILARWFVPAFAQQQPALYRGYYNMLTRTPVTGYTATCEAIRDADLSDTLPNIKTPTLVLCGSEDVSTPPNVVRALASKLPDGKFELVENAGHLPCIEQGDTVASLIKDFL